MKKQTLFLLLFLFIPNQYSHTQSKLRYPETWANWEKRLELAFGEFKPRNLPGQTKGIIVPGDARHDILPLTAFGFETLAPSDKGTILIFMSPPSGYPLNGIVMPEGDIFDTPFGNFYIDDHIRESLQNIDFPIFIDDTPFDSKAIELIQKQFAAIKYIMKGKSSNVTFLPIMVKLQDPNSQVKDLGPYLAEIIKERGLDEFIKIIILANLTKAGSESKLIEIDNFWLTYIRNQDIDGMLSLQAQEINPESGYSLPDFGPIALGTMILHWMGSDHAEILAYAHSGQLVLTKNKKEPVSYVVAGFASNTPYPPRIPHIKREKYVKIFDELFRSDILALTRQTVVSILDPSAAKPPSLLQKQAGKKWPVYVSLYTPDGQVAGEKGSHKSIGPLEESLRQFTFDAVKEAKPQLSKDSFQGYVVEVSIPYGFTKMSQADELIPLLNGIVVHKKNKSFGFHPNRWRIYPSPPPAFGGHLL